MYIQKLTIENIRGLKHFEMTFPDNPAGWHVIIGDNGAGKSTLIRAISLGLIGPNEVRAAHPNFAEWLRKGEKKGFVELALLGDKQHDFVTKLGKTGKLTSKVLLQSANSLSGLRGGTPLVEAIANDHAKISPDKYLWSSTAKGWFSAGFGPFRRFTGGDTELDKVYLSSPRCGAHLSVFGEDVALSEVLNWLKEIDYQQLKAREKKIRQNASPINLNLADGDSLPAGSESEILGEVTQLWEMAARLRTSGLFTEAESLLRRALAITEKISGPEHPSVAVGLSNLALLLQDTNQLAEADSLLRRALAIDETVFGPEHPNVATGLSNLAMLLKATNRIAEAEPLMRRALAIKETSFGSEHPSVAIGLSNLAQLLQDVNRLAEAEALMRRALSIGEASLGPEHPDVAIRLNNLALLLQDTNRMSEAEPLLRRALAIGEASLGPEHPDVAIRLNNLALLLQDTNRMSEAEPLLRRALAIGEARFGPEHPSVAIRLSNLALLLQNTNRMPEAEPLMRRALAINEASLGPNHPSVATGLSNLASLLQNTNRMSEAEPLMRRALAINETSLGPEHPNVATVLNNLALLLQDTNRLTEAELIMRRALAIKEASLNSEHPDIAMGLSNLAQLLQETNRLAEAEPLMRRALSIYEESFGPEHPRVAIQVKSLAQLIQDTHGIDAASVLVQQYQAKLAALPAISVTERTTSTTPKLPLNDNAWLALRLRAFINESRLLPNGTEFKEISADGPVFRDSNGQLVAVTELSDGFRSILSLAFELIRQLVRVYGLASVFPLNGKSGVIELPGVVLIDEVDTHLHPTWQTRIGQWFTECFPQIQFIVTTHTPLICRAVGETSGSIWRLPAPGQGQKLEEVTGSRRLQLRLGNVLDAYGTGLFGGEEVEQSAEAADLFAERARLSARESAGKASPEELKRLRELRNLFSSVDAEVEL
ncbi:tetratricopeptide repeat protein [Hymenobacter sp. DH14]|uniref:Tetratricopeptide repeat protein n=1 Tax=Hymenobacter cyanobacteriorum TaxID=2926463 RepID=A0A9X2AG39_9BACT|nr:tetratricopeptide repeat protein [Hymenobacter cyanobacteriorum]MCI1185890.1 tetratricopeptide repeat protein [Hymenobacter cyanobacteriorum]